MSYNSIYRRELFRDQIIVVPGGGNGIGCYTAHQLASLGAHVAIVARNMGPVRHGRRNAYWPK